MLNSSQVVTEQVKRLSPFFAQETAIPEFFAETHITANISAGRHIFWLGLGYHYDLEAHWAIANVKKNGNLTADWHYPDPRGYNTGIAPLSSYDNSGIVNRTMANLVWWLEIDNPDDATWEADIRERWIVQNPLRVSTVRTTGDATTDFDIAKRWLHSGGQSQNIFHKANVNAIAIWGIPEGYEIELWGIKLRRRMRSATSERLQRARVWRPWLRIAPVDYRSGSGTVIIPELLLKVSKRILGVRLYNPKTFARSPIRVIGPIGQRRSARTGRMMHMPVW